MDRSARALVIRWRHFAQLANCLPSISMACAVSCICTAHGIQHFISRWRSLSGLNSNLYTLLVSCPAAGKSADHAV